MLNIKAVIIRYCEMSLSALTDLKRWAKRNPFFDPEKFNNPGLRIATATNEAGHAICYSTIESAFVLGYLAHNPQATEVEMRSAGDYIEAALAHEAAQTGATMLFFVVPDNFPSVPDEEFIRVVKRPITPIVRTHAIGYSVAQATKFCS